MPHRPLHELVAIEETAAAEAKAKAAAQAAAQAAKARAEILSKIAADPDASLRQIDSLVTQKKRQAYEQIANLLVDLRESEPERQARVAPRDGATARAGPRLALGLGHASVDA